MDTSILQIAALRQIFLIYLRSLSSIISSSSFVQITSFVHFIFYLSLQLNDNYNSLLTKLNTQLLNNKITFEHNNTQLIHFSIKCYSNVKTKTNPGNNLVIFVNVIYLFII